MVDPKRKAFDDGARLILNAPVGFDTLMWRKAFLNLPKQERDEIKNHVSSRLFKLPGLERVALEYIRKSEFGSDYYHRPRSRGPYRPAAIHFLGGLMYHFLTATP